MSNLSTQFEALDGPIDDIQAKGDSITSDTDFDTAETLLTELNALVDEYERQKQNFKNSQGTGSSDAKLYLRVSSNQISDTAATQEQTDRLSQFISIMNSNI